MIGKWHLGVEPEFLPMKQGFDSYYGMPSNFGHAPTFFDGETELYAQAPLERLTQLYTERAVQLIKGNADKPFFMYFSHNYPHTPYKAGAAFRGSSRDGVRGDVIQELDWGVGEIMKALREAGIAENTIVLFTSDNGPTKPQYARPYRGTKYVTFEGGHRVPFLFHWPASIQQGGEFDRPVHAMDLFPTLSEIIGEPLPADREYDGVSLMPLLKGGTLARSETEPFFYYNCENLQAIRYGDWKLHLPRKPAQVPFWEKNKVFFELTQPVLYNLRADVGESHDVAEQHPEMVQQMVRMAQDTRKDLGEYMQRGSAQRPTGSIIPDARIISNGKDWTEEGDTMKSITAISMTITAWACVANCQPSAAAPATGSFASDLAFLEAHTDVVVLEQGDAAVAVVPAYQGRVMTSTFDDKAGPSFGWINRPVIEKGFLSDEEKKGKLEEHIYIFGGEERFWLGPEGGQYALFFKPGTKFEFSDWATPPVIDTEAFELVGQTEDSATFRHSTELVNYSGAEFKVGIERTVKLLRKKDASKLLGVELGEGLRMVGYETDNRITNTGSHAWTPETGLLSIWMLGMYNPSPQTTVVIPFKQGGEKDLGPRVNDTYFGKVPPEYLRVEKQKLFFKGDGTRRGKIGISPQRSKGIAGSYDAAGRVLNIVTYNVQDAPHGFVNSMWELQEEPYAGDVINSYNDGSPEPGKPPLGPFYELETSSPAAALKPGETMRHVQRTFHIQGSEAELDPVARRLLGARLDVIRAAF